MSAELILNPDTYITCLLSSEQRYFDDVVKSDVFENHYKYNKPM